LVPAHQFGRQLRQPIDLILSRVVFDRHVLALDIAGLFQALAESAQAVRECVGRRRVEKPDQPASRAFMWLVNPKEKADAKA
jgi:hypothetical protein